MSQQTLRNTEVKQGLKDVSDAAFDLARQTEPTAATVQAYAAEKGTICALQANIVESTIGAAGTHSASFVIPAGAVLLDILVTQEAVWDDGSGAAMVIGDAADADGYFASTNVKATDLVVGEVLSMMQGSIDTDGMWGGKQGAYLVAATGRRGPVSGNFGIYQTAGSTITATVTVSDGDGTAGKTRVVVLYVVPKEVTVTNAAS